MRPRGRRGGGGWKLVGICAAVLWTGSGALAIGATINPGWPLGPIALCEVLGDAAVAATVVAVGMRIVPALEVAYRLGRASRQPSDADRDVVPIRAKRRGGTAS